MEEEYKTPADVADMLQREAGKLYPRTILPEWAATVAQLESTAKRIRAIKSPGG